MKSVLVLFALFCWLNSEAQQKENSHVEIGINGGIPTGANAHNYRLVAGAGLKGVFYGKGDGSFDVSDWIALTISGGVYNAILKDPAVQSGSSKNTFIVPILGGFKIQAGKNQYLSFGGGWSYWKQETTNNAFGFEAGAGLNLRKVDLGLEFLGLVGKKNNFLGFAMLHLAYKIGT